jgi:hypothetical protein
MKGRDNRLSNPPHKFQNVAAEIAFIQPKLVLDINDVNFRVVYAFRSSNVALSITVFDDVERFRRKAFAANKLLFAQLRRLGPE